MAERCVPTCLHCQHARRMTHVHTHNAGGYLEPGNDHSGDGNWITSLAKPSPCCVQDLHDQ